MLGSLIWLSAHAPWHAPLEMRYLIRLNRHMCRELRLFWRDIEVGPTFIDPGQGPAGQFLRLPRVPKPVPTLLRVRQWTKARLEPDPLAARAHYYIRARRHSYAYKRA